MKRHIPPEVFVAAAIESLPASQRKVLETASRSGNWVARHSVVRQSAEEMVLDAIVGGFRSWCRAPDSVPFSSREIFEHVHEDATRRAEHNISRRLRPYAETGALRGAPQ